MAFCSSKISVALFLISLPIFSKGDNVSSVLSPFFDHVCDYVDCGKGTCQEASGQPFYFVCNCDPGWRKLRQGNDTYLEFLPCIIPNCSVDYSCMPAAPPAPPPPPVPYNLSFFDPCYWMYCGGGTCTKNSSYTHICQCNPGYSNLLDVPAFPCFSQCALGSDCSSLGIKVDNSGSSPSSSTGSSGSTSNPSPGSNANPAATLFPGKLQSMGFLLIFGVVLLWK